VNCGKNELNKAKKDLLETTKSLSKALNSESAKGKQVLALQLAKNVLDELAYAQLKLKGVSKVNNGNKKQMDNQLEAKHQLR
jgi:hypothetical protein